MRNRNTPILAEGAPFIAIVALVLLILVVFRFSGWLTLAWLLLTIFTIAFFRNPQREVPPGEDLIISPADGEVVGVVELDDRRFDMGRCRRVSIFMSPFNVHANRMPLTGRILEVRYHAGSFLVASAEKASLDNEQCAMIAQTPGGRRFVVVQIAGMLARRIVTYPTGGETVRRGQRFGLIRFGSRVDLYLPMDAQLDVQPGDHVRGAATILGRLPDGERV